MFIADLLEELAKLASRQRHKAQRKFAKRNGQLMYDAANMLATIGNGSRVNSEDAGKLAKDIREISVQQGNAVESALLLWERDNAEQLQRLAEQIQQRNQTGERV